MSTADYHGKAVAYARYRWNYADAALRALAAAINLPADATVADIGAGPAPLARWFAAAGFRRVYAVEPDAGMRAVAEQQLNEFPTASVIAGRAEQSRLPDQCVDLLIAGRALHWFDVTPTLTEFQRISRPAAFLATAAVRTTSRVINDTVRELLRESRFVVPEHARAGRPAVSLSDYCRPAAAITIQVEHSVSEDTAAFFQRLLTFSGTPLPGSDAYQLMHTAASAAFARLSDGPLLTIPLLTEIHAAPLRHAAELQESTHNGPTPV